MNKALGLLLLLGIVGNAYLAWELNSRIAPTNVELDADLAAVRAQRDALKAAGNPSSAVIDQIYAQTEAMLAQKRQALLRFVTLTYTVETRPVSPTSAAELTDIEAAIKQQQAYIETARTESAKYSTGLIQTLIQLRAETVALTLAGLEQRRLAAKYGVAIPTQDRTNTPNDGDRLVAIEQEIKEKKLSIANGKAEAQRYRGGLILAMLLSRIETEKLTVAMLEHRALAIKYGFALPTLNVDLGKPGAPPKAPGKIVDDKEAIQ